MSPTVFREEGFRFFFFSREEERMHVHVQSQGAEAKFWIEPEVALAVNHGFRADELRQVRQIVEENRERIESAWRLHFGG
ncbi:MAG: DUF4160 domain-containing protein [Lacipirellulaceae bacterium]